MKIVLLGAPGTGKSTIFSKLCFDAEPCQTVVGSDLAKLNLIFDKKSYEFVLWDISGSELNSPLMKVYLRDALGIFMVFDATRPETMDELAKYKEKVRLYC